MRNLVKLWIFLPLVSGVYPALAGASQQAATGTNAENFNNLVYLATSVVIMIGLGWVQRTFAKTTQKVETAEVKGALKQEELQAKIEKLEDDLALANIQKSQLEILSELSTANKTALRLLERSDTRQSTILDTQTRIEGSLSSVATEVDEVKDIAMKAVSQGATHQDTILNNLVSLETKITKAIADLHAAIEKRKTDSKPIPAVLETVNGQTTPEQSN